jgi:hypothetical protein
MRQETLSLVNKPDRRTVTVLLILIGLGAGSFTTWAMANAKGEAFVDRRIEVKTAPHLEQHDKAIEELRRDQERMAADVTAIRVDTAAIRQMVADLKESRTAAIGTGR